MKTLLKGVGNTAFLNQANPGMRKPSPGAFRVENTNSKIFKNDKIGSRGHKESEGSYLHRNDL